MDINKINFKLTVGASAEIAKFCPDKDLSKIGDTMQTYPDTVENGARFIRALNRGYVNSENAKDPRKGSGLSVISEDEILALEPDDFSELLERAMTVFSADRKTEVDAKPKKEEAPAEKVAP